jgi:hypothetical protein
MKTKKSGGGKKDAVVQEVVALLEKAQAHASLEDAVKDFPVALRGKKVSKLPYSAWQLVEHMRIAQRDILEFSDNEDGSYKPMKWPDDYWPKSAAPANAKAWEQSVKAIEADRRKFVKLLEAKKGELTKPFAWGSGQNLLREALLIADHNAYHVGELILLRRLLGCWK